MFSDFAYKIILVIFLFKMTKLYRDEKIMSVWAIKGGEKVKKDISYCQIAKCR